jgi:hypothetical protein
MRFEARRSTRGERGSSQWSVAVLSTPGEEAMRSNTKKRRRRSEADDDSDPRQGSPSAPPSPTRRGSRPRRTTRTSAESSGLPVVAGTSKGGDDGARQGRIWRKERGEGERGGMWLGLAGEVAGASLSTPGRRRMSDRWPSTASARAGATRRRRREKRLGGWAWGTVALGQRTGESFFPFIYFLIFLFVLKQGESGILGHPRYLGKIWERSH